MNLNCESYNVETELKTELNYFSNAEHILLMKKKKLKIDFNFFFNIEYFFLILSAFSAISEFKLFSDKFIEEITDQISVNESVDAFNIVSKFFVSDRFERVINQLFMSDKFINVSRISSAENNFKLSSVFNHAAISYEFL